MVPLTAQIRVDEAANCFRKIVRILDFSFVFFLFDV